MAIVLKQIADTDIAVFVREGHSDFCKFGGGNLPAFVLGAVAALLSGIFAIFVLPSPPVEQVKNKMARSASMAFH